MARKTIEGVNAGVTEEVGASTSRDSMPAHRRALQLSQDRDEHGKAGR